MCESTMENTGVERRVSSRLSGHKRPFYGPSSQKVLPNKERKVKNLNQRRREVLAQKEVMSDNDAANLEGIGAHKKVKEMIKLFYKHYLQQVQVELQRCNKESKSEKKPSKRPALKALMKKRREKKSKSEKNLLMRPDLKAYRMMVMTKKALYRTKRYGDLPGIDVGQQFYSRAEMAAVGLHLQTLKGIDYMAAGKGYHKLEQYKNYKFPLAVSIVISGIYEDNKDDSEEVVYTGEGGNNILGNKRQVRDQKLERGNLALKNSMEQKVPVRVIRGHKSGSSYCGKVYTYDGLYEVIKCWSEKGASRYKVYKYRLKRKDDQPPLTTSKVHYIGSQASGSASDLSGKVCEDISGGQESIPIPAFNLVDNPPVAPTGYTYCKSIQLGEGVTLPEKAAGCSCKGACINSKQCACAKLNGSDFPYVSKDGGRLIQAKSVVFECGPNCGCGADCVNKTSQKGLKYRFEVFRTQNKGWALRSRDFIPSGAPVCEYTGILRRAKDCESIAETDYLFDIDCLQTMKGLNGRQRRVGVVSIPTTTMDMSNGKKAASQPKYSIDAGTVGGVARFFNHSCDPNLFIQCVLSSHHDIELARIMLFAAENIPPLQELTYDYAYVLDSMIGPDGEVKVLDCHCGAKDCRGRLY